MLHFLFTVVNFVNNTISIFLNKIVLATLDGVEITTKTNYKEKESNKRNASILWDFENSLFSEIRCRQSAQHGNFETKKNGNKNINSIKCLVLKIYT